jgi:hypothetical protein
MPSTTESIGPCPRGSGAGDREPGAGCHVAGRGHRGVHRRVPHPAGVIPPMGCIAPFRIVRLEPIRRVAAGVLAPAAPYSQTRREAV